MKLISLTAFVLLAALTSIAQEAPGKSATDPGLQKQVEKIASVHNGKLALFAKNLRTGETVAIDPDHVVQTASVIKLPIMVEAFAQVQAGKKRLNEKIALKAEDRVSGSGVLPYMQPGLQMTLEDAITLMIILSDNTATNLVIDQVGIANVNRRLAVMGFKDTYLYKKVYKPAEGPMPADQKIYGLGKTTAREMAQVMDAVERCDPKATGGDAVLCKRMIEILTNQQYRESIPRYLETLDYSEGESQIANKTGALDRVRNDVAVVHSKGGPIVISAFTYENNDQSWTPDNEAYVTIAKIAKAIVNAWGTMAGTPAAQPAAR